MDIKLNNATGELYIEKGDVQFFEVYEYENRHLKVNIGLIFNDNKSALMKGVGIGWRE